MAASASPQSEYTTRDIETIAVGDEVLAWDERTNQLAWRRVVEVYRRTSDHLRLLDIRNADGSAQRLETTDEHPFYVDGVGYIEAAHITVGQPFRSPNGRPVSLLATAYEPRPEGVPVFNFQVEGLHNYFVSQTPAHQPLLVHNADYDITFNPTHAGAQPIPRGLGANGGRLQSHHALQQEWAAQNIPGYDARLAPTVTIETGLGFPHSTISALQNARRDSRVAAGLGKWSSTVDDELRYIVSDFRAAGFNDDTIRQVLQQQYRMLDRLRVTHSPLPGF